MNFNHFKIDKLDQDLIFIHFYDIQLENLLISQFYCFLLNLNIKTKTIYRNLIIIVML